MTALRAQPSPTSPNREGGVRLAAAGPDPWFTAADAAELLGITRSRINRRCQHEWGPAGLAEKRPSVGGEAWHIAPSAHPRLRRALVEATPEGRSTVTDLLAEATQARRTAAETRANITIRYRRWRCLDETVVARDWPAFKASMEAKYGLCPSLRRVQEMDQACPLSSDFAGCVAALLDTRGRPASGSTTCSDEAWRRFASLYLHANCWSLSKCWRTVRGEAAEHGWDWPSLSTIRGLAADRFTPEMVCLKREGADAWRRRFEVPIGQDPDAWAPGQCWEGDHSELDLFVRVFRGGKWTHDRPWLTAWIDRRTRRLMGWHLSLGGDSQTVRQALLNGLRTDGVSVPEAVWIDNGKDYASASIAGFTKTERRTLSPAERKAADNEACGILQHLGIEAHFALPYNHNGKARVERFFGTVHGDFDREFASYAGHAVGMLDKKDRAARIADPMSLPTIDEVRERFAAWAEFYNARSEHAIDDLVCPDSGERLSPLEYYQRHLPALRVVKDSSLVLLEQRFTRPLKVHKWGVSLKIGNKTVRYGEHAAQLRDLIGTDRLVRVSYDESDLRSVRIFDEGFRLLCVANENGRHGGLSADPIRKADVQAAHAARRQYRKDLKRKIDFVAGSLSDAELSSKCARDREVDETRARLAEERGTPSIESPPLRLVTTPVDHQDAEAVEMKQAAGGEVWADDEPRESVIDLLARRHEDDEPTDFDDDDDRLDIFVRGRGFDPTDDDGDDDAPMDLLLNRDDEDGDEEAAVPSVLNLLADQAEDA